MLVHGPAATTTAKEHFQGLQPCCISVSGLAKAPGDAGAQPDLGTPRVDGLLDVLWLYECIMLLELLALTSGMCLCSEGKSQVRPTTLPVVTQEGECLRSPVTLLFISPLQRYLCVGVDHSGLLYTVHTSTVAFISWRCICRYISLGVLGVFHFYVFSCCFLY